MPEAYRQGDVVVKRVPDNLLDFAGARVNKVAIAGETGNAHVLEGFDEAREHWEPELGGRVFVVRASQVMVLRHPEHPDIEIPPGTWMVYRVREFIVTGVRGGGD